METGKSDVARSPYDEREIRCPRLGGQVKFAYCAIESSGKPCSRALTCWTDAFDVSAFFLDLLGEEMFSECFFSLPKPKMETLMDLIVRAKKVGENTHKPQ